MTKILGPVPCIGCGKPVWWDRVGTALRLMEGRQRHVCDANLNVVRRVAQPTTTIAA